MPARFRANPQPRRSFHPAVEGVERRVLLATFIVTNTSDSAENTGSLRYALQAANADLANDDTIDFQIPTTDPGFKFDPGATTGFWTIPISSPLTISKPEFQGVQHTVSIDGLSQQSQSGAAQDHPVIVITQGSGFLGTAAFSINSSQNTVSGLVVNGFQGSFGMIVGGSGNHVSHCYIGTDPKGNSKVANGEGLGLGGTMNTLDFNVISGNSLVGILSGFAGVSATSGSTIQDNFIGTSYDGSLPLGNGFSGIHFVGSSGNTISGNVLSDNGTMIPSPGILFQNGAHGNLVQGNKIGTNATGTTMLPNHADGVTIDGPDNTIGGTASGAGNIISGNASLGINIQATAGNNQVMGNWIGTDGSGTAPLPNNVGGIFVSSAGNLISGNIISSNGVPGFFGDGVTLSGSNNTVGGTTADARNVISGNRGQGLRISGTSDNTIAGNFIGVVGADGATALGNGSNGILLDNASANTISGNVISGNGTGSSGGSGLAISGSGAQGNLVQANLIGSNAAGAAALPNLGDGVAISGPNNTVGGTAVGARNIISGNQGHGLSISGASGTAILGNYIGAGSNGATALGNGLDGILLKSAAGNTVSGNVISGNGTGSSGGNGLTLSGSGAQGNLVRANFIGTNAAGTGALPNLGDGVAISGPNNTVGGTAAGARNVISGNQSHGLSVSGTSGNLILDNDIGAGPEGTTAVGNVLDGIFLDSASANTISGNVISANGVGQDAAGINMTGSGSTGNLIRNNWIGTDANGTNALGNSLHGVFIGDGASNNMIGPANVIWGNGLASNQGVGVYLFGATTTGNQVVGNQIGTDVNVDRRLNETVIGVLISQAPGNTVQGNLISGNRIVGMEIAGATASGNQVLGNKIGTDAAGTRAIPNGFDGVFVNDAPNNTIGGTSAGAGNLISGNGSVGIQLFGPQAVGNVVVGNAIGLDSAGRLTLPNRNGGIFVNTGPQANQIGGTALMANAGQKRPTFSLSGFHQAHRARRAQTKSHAVRQKAVVHHGTPPALRPHPHWPITGGVVKAAALAAPLPKGILSIRANSPLNGKGPVTGRT
jgi:titin